MRICFFRVKDNLTKLQKICETVGIHFIKKNKVLIAVSSKEAAAYIDHLLWKMPEEGFIPHSIKDSETKEPIVITTSPHNLNQADIIINLLPALHPNPGPAKTIYELLDFTSKEKEEISRKKLEHYQLANYFVEEF